VDQGNPVRKREAHAPGEEGLAEKERPIERERQRGTGAGARNRRIMDG